ncbi:hypothetical protein M9H77_18677 [Catharanthus roseus]|uniref:Uncharacterized protein n=1 Tax=Catharanthus roseus TaxID=4058 RepID=A0ACC0B830_CATRO|nr:hypothetical protein M9H77_18677 [Catharanthus roseus]
MEEEHQGKIAGSKKMIQDMAWQVIGDQEEDFKRSQTILWSSVQVEKSKEANLGRLEASKTKKGAIYTSYRRCRSGPTVAGANSIVGVALGLGFSLELKDRNLEKFSDSKSRVEDRKSMEKELGPTLEDISIRLSLNISSLWNLFLLVPSMKTGPSSYLSLEDPLMSSSVMLDHSCYGFGNLDDTFLVELNIVGFALGIDRNFPHACTIHQ